MHRTAQRKQGCTQESARVWKKWGVGEGLREVGSWTQASCTPDSLGELTEARSSSLGLGLTALNEDNKTHHCPIPRRLG